MADRLQCLAYIERITDAFCQNEIFVIKIGSILQTTVSIEQTICLASACHLLHAFHSSLRISAESTA